MRRPLLLAGAAVGGVLLLAYGGSFLLSGADVPRGVHVAGVDLSGLSADRAETLLAERLAERAAAPLELVAAEVTMRLDPRTAKRRETSSCPWPSTETAQVPVVSTTSWKRATFSAQNSTRTGSSDTEVKELQVIACCSSSSSVVMTVTPVANRPTTRR